MVSVMGQAFQRNTNKPNTYQDTSKTQFGMRLVLQKADKVSQSNRFANTNMQGDGIHRQDDLKKFQRQSCLGVLWTWTLEELENQILEFCDTNSWLSQYHDNKELFCDNKTEVLAVKILRRCRITLGLFPCSSITPARLSHCRTTVCHNRETCVG